MIGSPSPPCAAINPLLAWRTGSKPGVFLNGPFPHALTLHTTMAGLLRARVSKSIPNLSADPKLKLSITASHCVASAWNDRRPFASFRSSTTRALPRFNAAYVAAGHRAERIPGRLLDLEHRRPEVLQHARRERTRDEGAHVQHAHSLERQAGGGRDRLPYADIRLVDPDSTGVDARCVVREPVHASR